MQVTQAIIKAGCGHFIIPRIDRPADRIEGQFRPGQSACVASHAVIAQAPEKRRQFTVVGGQHAALAGGNGFHRVARKHRDATERTGADGDVVAGHARIAAAQGMARVLDQSAAIQHRPHGRKIDGLTGEMNRHDGRNRAGGGGEGGGGGRWCHQARFSVDIGENHLAADEAHGVGGGQKSDRRHQHPVAGCDATGQRRQVQAGGATRAGDRVSGAGEITKAFFISVHRRAGGQPIATQNLDNGGDVLVIEHLSTIGQKGGRVADAVAAPRSHGRHP